MFTEGESGEMSDPHPHGPDALDDARQIDRLVSGDLDEAERSALVSRLDEEPARWRRVGLAFLEAQTWHESFAAMGHGPQSGACDMSRPDQRVGPVVPPQRRAKRHRAAALCRAFCVAASLAVAFALGWSSRAWDGPDGSSPVAGSTDTPRETSGAKAATGADARRKPAPPGGESPASRIVGVLRLRSGEGEIRRPVFRATSLNQELKRLPPEIPDYVRSQWERRGYRVSESPRLVRLQTRDGRRLLWGVNRVTLDRVARQSL
ncbi:MAG: hypothetical protein ACYTG0_21065 [Planctomycetota bacterium]|jgi:hypothetical protein